MITKRCLALSHAHTHDVYPIRACNSSENRQELLLLIAYAKHDA